MWGVPVLGLSMYSLSPLPREYGRPVNATARDRRVSSNRRTAGNGLGLWGPFRQVVDPSRPAGGSRRGSFPPPVANDIRSFWSRAGQSTLRPRSAAARVGVREVERSWPVRPGQASGPTTDTPAPSRQAEEASRAERVRGGAAGGTAHLRPGRPRGPPRRGPIPGRPRSPRRGRADVRGEGLAYPARAGRAPPHQRAKRGVQVRTGPERTVACYLYHRPPLGS